MSSRPDGSPRRYGLTDDDDWFSAPPSRPPARRDEWLSPGGGERAPFDHDPPTWPDEPDDVGDDDGRYDEPPPAGHPFGDRRWTPILAAAGIVAVIVVAVVVVRSLGGSGASSTTPTTPVLTDPTVIDTTGASTTGIDTTGIDTTRTDTTGTDTTGTDTTGTDTTGTDTTGTRTTTTPTATVTEVPTGQSLKPGMSGSSVLTLQQALVQLAYDPGTPDGSYGPGTTQAVTAFQAANSLTQDGMAGPATLDAINAQLARG